MFFCRLCRFANLWVFLIIFQLLNFPEVEKVSWSDVYTITCNSQKSDHRNVTLKCEHIRMPSDMGQFHGPWCKQPLKRIQIPTICCLQTQDSWTVKLHNWWIAAPLLYMIHCILLLLMVIIPASKPWKRMYVQIISNTMRQTIYWSPRYIQKQCQKHIYFHYHTGV